MLPGLAWVQIEPAAVEADRRLEVLDIADPGGHALDLLNLAIVTRKGVGSLFSLSFSADIRHVQHVTPDA